MTEEYAEVDGELRLTRRKETRKDIPPDLKAVQMLLAEEETDYSAMSDEELAAEKVRAAGAAERDCGTGNVGFGESRGVRNGKDGKGSNGG